MTLSLAGLMVAGCAKSSMPTGFKDGTYSAVGSYRSPAGPEEIQVTITLANSVITNATVQGASNNPVSSKMIKAFADGFLQQVVGKPLNELSLHAVSGASLTTNGFMDAVAKIGQQAGV